VNDRESEADAEVVVVAVAIDGESLEGLQEPVDLGRWDPLWRP
jgi:hypothetical protein